jgi:hypothetical protein
MAKVNTHLTLTAVVLTLDENEAALLQRVLGNRSAMEDAMKVFPSNGTRGEMGRMLADIKSALDSALADAELAAKGQPRVMHMHPEKSEPAGVGG